MPTDRQSENLGPFAHVPGQVEGGYQSIATGLKSEKAPDRMDWAIWDATAVAALVGGEVLGEGIKWAMSGFVETAPFAETAKQTTKLVLAMIPVVGYLVQIARVARFDRIRHLAGRDQSVQTGLLG